MLRTPLLWLHKHPVTSTRFTEPFLYLLRPLLVNMQLSHLYLPSIYTQPASQRDFFPSIPSPLPSPFAFLSEEMMMMMMIMKENMTPDYGRPHKKKLSEEKNQTPTQTHTNKLWYPNTFEHNANIRVYTPQRAAPSGGGVSACNADLTIHGDTRKKCHIRKLLTFCLTF